MSMSSCEKCWDTLCTCGWQYRDWTPERLDELIATLKRVRLEGGRPPVPADLFTRAAMALEAASRVDGGFFAPLVYAEWLDVAKELRQLAATWGPK